MEEIDGEQRWTIGSRLPDDAHDPRVRGAAPSSSSHRRHPRLRPPLRRRGGDRSRRLRAPARRRLHREHPSRPRARDREGLRREGDDARALRQREGSAAARAARCTSPMSSGMLGANGIVGGGPPMVCGVGLSAKVRGTDQVGVAFVGDGGSNQGTFLESLNLAAVWNLPSVFVVENNGYAEATSSAVPPGRHRRRQAGRRLRPAGRRGRRARLLRRLRGGRRRRCARARAGGGPSLLECKVNRYYGHFEGDQQTYRGRARSRRSGPDPRLPRPLRRAH